MPASGKLRLLALIGLVALLAAAGCRRGGDTDEEVDITEPPTSPTPSIEAVADFQLVGRIDEAFAGQLPDVDLPEDAAFEQGAAASPSPAPTPVGENPPRGGILRVEIEALSDGLKSNCGVDTDDVVEVFWTTGTFFEPPTVLDDFDDIEDDIEDRTTGISGSIFRTDEVGGFEPAPTPTPEVTGETAAATASPGEDDTSAVQDTDCILVAEQLGFTTTRLPTPRPRVAPQPPGPTPAQTATPTTPRATSTPRDTVEPTERRTEKPGDTGATGPT